MIKMFFGMSGAAFMMTGVVWSMDCQIEYKGVAKSGYAAGKLATAKESFSNRSVAECEKRARQTLASTLGVQYSSERVYTSKHRPSPLSKAHYLSPTSARWCVGAIQYWGLSFEEDECQSISSQSQANKR